MAWKSKYPWIPKEYYAAVMFACKMIRENGCCNKDVHIAADYYGGVWAPYMTFEVVDHSFSTKAEAVDWLKQNIKNIEEEYE